MYYFLIFGCKDNKIKLYCKENRLKFDFYFIFLLFYLLRSKESVTFAPSKKLYKEKQRRMKVSRYGYRVLI